MSKDESLQETFEFDRSEAAKALSALGAAKGGKARAKALTPEERSNIARAAVEARWRKEGKLTEVPEATHGSPDRPLRIGDLEIPAYVLADGRRVLVQKNMISALGMTPGGSSLGRDRLAKFVGQDRLKDFVPKHLSSGTLSPIEFKTPQGMRALGYEATILADICDAVLDARKAGKLTKKQSHIATHCEILMRSFARVGIIALVDEVTGYQADRARDALAKILEAFVAKEIQKWVRTFEADFYQELFRLRNLPYNGTCKRPQYIGHLTNDLVYSRLAPGVLEELRRITPKDEKGRRKGTFSQRLTPDIGVPRLREHVKAVTVLMKASDTWEGFMPMLERSLPKQVELPLFDGREEKPLHVG